MNFENIKLDRFMYKVSGKSFSDVLEAEDRSDAYKGTPYADLDAYQRQLKRFDIKVSSPACDKVEKFFSTAESAALFPEYLSRAVRTGIEENDVLPAITAATTMVDSMDYRSIASVPSDDDKSLKPVGEGAYIPQTTVKLKENLIRLYKRGRMLVSSYEALRFQKLDVFTVTLRQIGAYIAKSRLSDAVDVLINGDGNNNAAELVSVAAAGTLTYADLLTLWGKFKGYEMNTLLMNSATMVKLLNLSEFKNPDAEVKVKKNGTYFPALGVNVIRCDSVPDNRIVALDKNCALEAVVAEEIHIDHDKVIDRQLEQTAITSITGFAKLFPDAVKVLKI